MRILKTKLRAGREFYVRIEKIVAAEFKLVEENAVEARIWEARIWIEGVDEEFLVHGDDARELKDELDDLRTEDAWREQRALEAIEKRAQNLEKGEKPEGGADRTKYDERGGRY